MCPHIIYSSSLHGTDVSDTGLLFSAGCLSPFLNIQDTFAFSQSFGSLSWSIERWNMMVNAGARWSAYCFRSIWYVVWTRCLGGVYIPQEFCYAILCDFDVWNVGNIQLIFLFD